jgi:hypothetical protein
LTIVKPILITVLDVQQGAFAMHNSNSTISTWITQNGAVAQTIDLNKGPLSPPTPGGDTIGEATTEEEPSAEPAPTTTD